MSTKEAVVWICGIGAILIATVYIAQSSIESTRLKTEAQIAKSYEMTKRAEGRHKILDLLGHLR